MVNNLIETLGYGLVIAFLYLLWAPLALLGAGLLLVAYANVRAARPGARGRTAAAVGAAIGAARAAYRRQQDVTDVAPVRRIS